MSMFQYATGSCICAWLMPIKGSMRLQLMGYHSCPEKADHGQLIYGLRHQQKVISPAYQGSKIQQTKAIFISYMFFFSKEHDFSAGCQPLFNHINHHFK